MQPPTTVHVITGLEAAGAETMLCKLMAASTGFRNLAPRPVGVRTSALSE